MSATNFQYAITATLQNGAKFVASVKEALCEQLNHQKTIVVL